MNPSLHLPLVRPKQVFSIVQGLLRESTPDQAHRILSHSSIVKELRPLVTSYEVTKGLNFHYRWTIRFDPSVRHFIACSKMYFLPTLSWKLEYVDSFRRLPAEAGWMLSTGSLNSGNNSGSCMPLKHLKKRIEIPVLLEQLGSRSSRTGISILSQDDLLLKRLPSRSRRTGICDSVTPDAATPWNHFSQCIWFSFP